MTKTRDTYLLAVYGSLRRGMGNSKILGDSELLSTETIQAQFKMVDMGSFPGLIESDEYNDIVIEIYKMSKSVWDRIIQLEGYPSFYDRKNVHTTEGEVGIYYLPGRSGWSTSDRLVEKFDGAFDWCQHYKNKHKNW